MSTITMPPIPMSYATYSLYDDPSLNQECIDMPPHSFSQSVGGVEFDPLPYSASLPVSYTSPMMTISPPNQPLSIYTTNLDNFSSSSLSSAATSTTSSAYYPDLNFAQCGVDGQWTHVDDGYVSGDTSPILQGLSHDAFYPVPSDQQVLLVDGSSLANLDIGAQVEPTSILGEAPTLVQTTTEQQLQYSIFDQTSQSPEMGALGMADPSDSYITSAESSPILTARSSPNFGPRSKSATSRSPSPPPQQSYYSTFDNKGTPIKCPHKGCAKAFGRVYNLKTHLKSHVSTKPWECPMCPRSFTRKHDLQRHVRVHTGQKPYVCPCCHKRFARTDALTRHIRVEDSCRLSEEVANYKGRRRYSDLS